MQSSEELSSSPSLSEEFSWKMTLDGGKTEEFPPSDEESGDDEDDFSFACVAADELLICADDVFQNGQIKPIFPLFDRSLLWDGDSAPSRDDLPRRPPVKKVFVEVSDSLTAEGEDGEAAASFCEWAGKAVEASPEICKKSNSTGFSKLFRFRDLLNRSNSDGRDAFVFLNGSTAATSKREEVVVEKSESTAEAKNTTAVGGGKVKGRKRETASLSAHYVRNRELREGDRRRTYLPYRPTLVGFFTNVQGGISRNVHPF